MQASTSVHRICPFCEACCGLKVDIETDAATGVQQVVKVRGDDDDVFSKGFLCPKAVGLKDLHEDPDRLRAPLIKRNGVFEQASWEAAYAFWQNNHWW